MAGQTPPTLDARATTRWLSRNNLSAPWLHEEIGRRMQQRLDLILQAPESWLHWEPLHGGTSLHAGIVQRYPKSQAYLKEHSPVRERAACLAIRTGFFSAFSARWLPSRPPKAPPADGVGMVWANMRLHLEPDPQSLLKAWLQALRVGGYVMFSCLGPDSLRELREVYQKQGWPAPHADWTDMHDWGDMMVQAGFAEPVMDMERITLSYSSPEALLSELRQMGRNWHRDRFPAMRSAAWKQRLLSAIEADGRRDPETGRWMLSFEVVYGHAYRPIPRPAVQPQAEVSLDEMRKMLGLKRSN